MVAPRLPSGYPELRGYPVATPRGPAATPPLPRVLPTTTPRLTRDYPVGYPVAIPWLPRGDSAATPRLPRNYHVRRKT